MTDEKILLLEQIQKSYDRELELKKSFENKAINIIMVSGFLVTILFGFTTFLSQDSDKIQWFHYIPILGSIISIIIASIYALFSLRITRYYYVLSTDSSNKTPLIDTVNKFKGLDKEKSLDNFIDAYMFSIENNALHNEQSALYISKSQKCLFIALPWIVITIILVLITSYFQ